MRYYCLLIFFLLASGCLQAQETPSDSTKEAIDLSYFDKAWELYLENIDSAIFYLEQGLPYYRKKESWTHYVDCYSALASCYYYKYDFIKSLEYSQLAMAEAERLLLPENDAYSSALNNIARLLKEKGDFEPAIARFKEALKIENDYGTEIGKAVILNNFGNLYMEKGDFAESRYYYAQALDIRIQEFGANAPELAYTYVAIAKVFETTGQLDTAMALYQKCLYLLSRPDVPQGRINNSYLFRSHFALAKIALKKKSSPLFLQHIAAARKIAEREVPENLTEVYSLMSQHLLDQGAFAEAEKYLLQALEHAQKNYQAFPRHPMIGRCFGDLAKINAKAKKFPQSLVYFQKALVHYSKEFTDGNFSNNPADTDLISDVEVIEILKGKAQTLLDWYHETPEEGREYLDAAVQTYQLTTQTIRRFRQSLLARDSKTSVSQLVMPVYEGALNALILQNQREQFPDFLNQAFQLIESNKSILLLESINENLAKGFASIPDPLREKERQLKLDITFYEKKIREVKNKGEQNHLAPLEKQLFDLRQQHQNLIFDFEQNYPLYHQAKYNTQLASIAEVQQNLPDDQTALLEYFVGEKTIFLFCITKQQASIYNFPKKAELSDQISTLRHCISTPPNHDNPQKQFDQFVQWSNQLYTDLVEPAQLPVGIDRLIIIPDDLLNYIPFEVLLQELPAPSKMNYAPQNLAYLLNDFAISYNYSTSLLLQSRNHQKPPKGLKDFIGFAPAFKKDNPAGLSLRDCTDADLFHLDCNQQEVEKIANLLHGRAMLDKEAAKATFQQEAAQYHIIHLATHSCLDDDDPMLNKIFLSDGHISNYDLYNLELNADLAVLSACNTGSGSLLRGEGIMSLYRGFLHAGCPSALISLWTVEDCTTSDIMGVYYQRLLDRHPKDRAIQEAKKSYLASADRLHAHPFYWAPFVQFGNTNPLTLGLGHRWLWWILGGLGILLLLFFAYRTYITSTKQIAIK